MTTSGTYAFAPQVREILDEAWERGTGRDPAEIDVRHIKSALRSLNLLLRSELSADQINLWKVAEFTSAPAQSASSLSLPAGAIDVLEATARDATSNTETPMLVIGRADWRVIPDKALEGRPDRFWVDRTTGLKTLHFWPAMDANGYTLVFNVLYGIQDAGDLSNEADLPPDLWQDVVVTGLAKRLAEKWAPDRLVMCEAKFMAAHRLAKNSNAESGSIIITPDYSQSGRR